MRGHSEKKLVSLEEGVADLKVRRKNRISIVGDFRFTLPRERKRWMEKKGRKPKYIIMNVKKTHSFDI